MDLQLEGGKTSWTALIRDEEAYPGVAARFDYEVADGELEATETFVQASGPEADELVRAAPLATWRRVAKIRIWQKAIQPAEELGTPTDKVHASMQALLAGDRQPFNDVLWASTLLQTAATEYVEHVAAGVRDPVAQIARSHGVPPATAAGWIFRARKAGYLAPAKYTRQEPKEA
jgi:hypothetical protein